MQDQYKEITIMMVAWITLSIVFIGIVVFIILFYQKKRFVHQQQLIRLQQEMLKTQLETQEATFRQIGNEIHDNVGQLLSTAKILLAIAARSIGDPPEAFHTATETISKAILELRALSKSLNKEWLEKFNIIDNLSGEIDRINMAGTIVARLEIIHVTITLDTESQIMLFRIIQEAIQNCIKHAEASEINIMIKKSEKGLLIRVADNGIGLDINESGQNGIGLLTMKHRTKLLGGTINWKRPGANGTEIVIEIPGN